MANPVRFLDAFRFAVSVNSKPISLAEVGPIEVLEERHGGRRIRPVTLRGAPMAGCVGLAAFVRKAGRCTVDLAEQDKEGNPTCGARTRMVKDDFCPACKERYGLKP